MFIATQTLLVHWAMRMMRLFLPLLLRGMVGTRLTEIIIQLTANATFTRNQSVLKNLGVIVILPRILLLFFNDAHNKGLKGLRDILGLTLANVIHAVKAMAVDAGLFLEFLAALLVNDVDKPLHRL